MGGNVINYMTSGGNIVSNKDEYEKRRNRARNEIIQEMR